PLSDAALPPSPPRRSSDLADVQDEPAALDLLDLEAAGLGRLLVGEFGDAVHRLGRQRQGDVEVRRAGPPRVEFLAVELAVAVLVDRKSTRLNSSHVSISYA